MLYPNLIEEHRQYWHIEAMARGANVTPELMIAVLKGEESLTSDEAFNLSRYMLRKPSYLFSPILSVLKRKSNRHQRWMADLNLNMKEIWEASKKGDYWALNFVNTNKRIRYVNMELRFQDGREVTCAEYMAVKSDMAWALNDVREKQRKPRGLEVSACLI